MRKFITSNLLGIMFAVGAASGFLVSNIGWWGLERASQDLEQIYQTSLVNVLQVLNAHGNVVQWRTQAAEMLAGRADGGTIDDLRYTAQRLDKQLAELQQDTAEHVAIKERLHGMSGLYAGARQAMDRVQELLPRDRGAARKAFATEAQPRISELLLALQTIYPAIYESSQKLRDDAAAANARMRVLLIVTALAATFFFCLTTWLTYRQSLDRRRKTVQLNQERIRFTTLFESSDDAILLFSDRHIFKCNRAARELFGVVDAGEMDATWIARSMPKVQPDGRRSDELFAEKLAACESSGPQRFEWHLRRGDGTDFPAELLLTTARLGGDDVLQVTVRDLTQQKQAENALRLSARVFENTLEGVMITDERANILAVNRAFTAITGYAEEDVVGQNPRLLQSGRHDATFYEELWATLATTGQWQGEIWNKRKSGDVYPQWCNISRVWDEHAKVSNYVAVFSDISERKSAEENILKQVYFDSLTELPNRVLFVDRLKQGISLAQRTPNRSLALLALDVDRFKLINESFGHEAGDRLMRLVAQRLTECIRETDTVARMNGDEFSILLASINHAEDAVHVANHIIERFREPFEVKGNEVYLAVSVGISIFPGDGNTANGLMKNADMARYHAKKLGGMVSHLYNDDLKTRAGERVALETALRKALLNDEFVLYYQPQCDYSTGDLIGFEALIRWISPERGFVPPDQFIPLAEETGLIIDIGNWVLRKACREAQSWRAMPGGENVVVAVNLSTRQLMQEDIRQQVEAALQETGLPASGLELEITESSMMHDVDASIRVMRALAEQGVQFAIDDFGTGYSSLAYLKKLPIHALKIDKSFVRDIHTDRDSAAIVSAIIAMANRLGIKVVAEGIEYREQVDSLTHQVEERSDPTTLLRCQGYLYGRPSPPEKVTELIQANTRIIPSLMAAGVASV